jgi:superfamily I DNA/RNA helicase
MTGLGSTLRPRMIKWSTLNPEQRRAVETVRGPVLILAGAGTGKTRVITCRIAHLMEQGTDAGNILAVTFTNKAAREMQSRVSELLPRRGRGGEGERPVRPTICTFHSLCVRILRKHIGRLGYKPNFVIYDESEQLGVIRKLLSRVSTNGPQQDASAVLGLLSRYRNGLPGAGAFADANVAMLAEHLRGRYEAALRACNAVDFDDLILLVLRLFREHEEVLESCREQYRYVMVDEYQDTNAAQYELMCSLTAKHRNLCVVGDDDQSIYGWRGAEISNLLDLERHYPEVKIVKLERNYRSTTNILEAANAVIRNNARRRSKRLWSDRGAGALITVHAFESDEEEARELVEEMQSEHLGRRMPWNDFAILFRTNIQSRPLETALRQARVPYRLIGGQSFFDRREVRDFLAYLKLFSNPDDDISLLRVANVPARGLTTATMERFLGFSHERNCPVFGAMRSAEECEGLGARARESATRFVELVDAVRGELRGTGSWSARRWGEALFERMGYFADLRRSEKDAETAENRVQNLKDLLTSLEEHRSGAPALERIETFLEEVTLDTERQEEKEQKVDAATLITIHSCKGLEFRRVYIAGVEDGLLPHARSTTDGSLDEERRLFYVAMTRAMEKLVLSHCAQRKKYGQLVPCHPSRFLKELPVELTEDGQARGRTMVPVKEGGQWFAGLHAALDGVPEAPG